MSKALTKIAPAWHAEAVAELNKDFVEISAIDMAAKKRRAYLGLKLHYIKERGKLDESIPHGSFDDWMKVNCPNIKRRTAQRYMNEAKSICERMGWQIRQIGAFEIPPHKLIEMPEVPPKERKAQQLLLELMEDDGKYEAVTEYKQVDKEGRPTRGNKSGKGCTKEMRLKAQWADDLERLTALQINTGKVIDWIKENLTLDGFARLPEIQGGEATLTEIKNAFKEAHLFMQNLDKGAK